MDQETRDKVHHIYETYLRNDPQFQSFYKNITPSNSEHTRGPEIRRGVPNQKRVLETPKVTAEAEQVADKEIMPEKKQEKARTLFDLIMQPRDQEEQIISAAAKSGLVRASDEKDLKSHEATLGNVKGLVNVLEQRAHVVHQHKMLERERKEHQKEDQEEKEQSAAKPKEHSSLPKFEYGLMKDIENKLREALVNNKGVGDGPQTTPKGARDKAQSQKDFTGLPPKGE